MERILIANVDTNGQPSLPTKAPFLARGGIAAAAHPFVAEAGLEVLREGGNAIDASIAAAAVMMCMDSCNSHLGGDTFCLIHRADGSVHAINGSGVAPAGATLEFFQNRGGIPATGLPRASVPGTVDAWFEANRRFGKLPMRKLLARGIEYARNGVPVTAHFRKMLTQDAKILGSHPVTAGIFLRDGKMPEIGETLRQPLLARSLERVADGGSDEFYRGSLAREMLAFSKGNGGLFADDDFATHASDVAPALSTSYRGFTIFTEPPVSPGIVMLFALRILERFEMRRYDPFSPERYHLILEAVKLAFEDRATLGDPRTVENEIERKLSDAHADRQAARINLRRASASSAPGNVSAGTESAVFADAEGNVVAYIQSVDHSCGVVLGETGVLMNGRMGSFSLDPASPNVVAPGKRPIHTLTDYVVHDSDGNFRYAGGTPGGNFQVQINLQILTNLIDYGMSVTEAVYAPRITLGETRVMTDPIVRIESRMPSAVAEELARLGHRVQTVGPWDNPGAVQLIARDPHTGMYAGATEIRRSDCIVSGF